MDKTILLTGHTGFLGSYIYASLSRVCNVVTLGRENGCDYVVDFLSWDGSLNLSHSIFAIVHAAGLAHGNHFSKHDYDKVNTESVKHLKTIARRFNIPNFVFINSVNVCGAISGDNLGVNSLIRNKSPFIESKIKAENILRKDSPDSAHNLNWLILRLPLVIGSNPPGNLARLMNSVKSGKHIYLIGNSSKRSVVRAEDVATFIGSWLASSNRESATLNLCNQVHPSFNWIENSIAQSFNANYRFRIPIGLIRRVIIILHTSLGVTIPVISKILLPLTFDDSLARNEFNYQSKPLTAKLFSDDINPNH